MNFKSYFKCISLFALLSLLATCKEPDPLAECGGDGIICSIAGIGGEAGASGNGGAATKAFLYWPQDVTLDKNGIVYILDWNNHCVRRIKKDGTIDRFIGSGQLGDESDALATEINLNHPTGLTIDANGDFWLSAWHNWKFKKIDHTTLMTTTEAGSSQGFLGDGGVCKSAKFDLPSSLVFDSQGNRYLSDQANQRIRKIDVGTNIIHTIAGNGTTSFADGIDTAAHFNFPKGSNAIPGGKIALSNDESYLLIADTYNNRLRKLDLATKMVTTIAGTGNPGFAGDNGPAIAAELHSPTDVEIAKDGSIYIADAENHAIRKIDANGNISTVAGKLGRSGNSSDGTKAKNALLNQPSGIAISDDNVLYIADTNNQQVKIVKNP